MALELEKAKMSITDSHCVGEYVVSVSKLDRRAVESKLTKPAAAIEGRLVYAYEMHARPRCTLQSFGMGCLSEMH